MAERHVTVLMGVYDGARFLQEQLDSLVAQDHGAWSLIASDDGSTDASIALLDAFQAQHPARAVEIRNGPGRGFARNFVSLIAAAPGESDYVAFCDQDDVWLPQKLSQALAHFATIPADRPAMVCGRSISCDAALNKVGLSPLFDRTPSFANALVQSLAAGNTMVINRAGLHCLKQAAPFADEIVVHDWWAYQVITAVGGTVIYDPEPAILYRQHEANLIGVNTGAKDRLGRLGLLFQGRFRGWTDQTYRSLEPILPQFTEQSQQVFHHFAEAREGALPHRLRALVRSGVYRQTKPGNAALWLGVALNRI